MPSKTKKKSSTRKPKGKRAEEEDEEDDEDLDDEDLDEDEDDEDEEDDDESDEDDDDESDEDDEDDEDDGEAQRLRDENNRLKREAAKKAKAEREERRKKLKRAGKYEEIAAEETQRADKAEADLQKLQRQINVSKVAGNLQMKHPEDASKFLDEDDMDDERLTERALKRLKERRPELFNTKRRSAGPSNESDDDDDDDREGKGPPAGTGFDRLRSVKRKT